MGVKNMDKKHYGLKSQMRRMLAALIVVPIIILGVFMNFFAKNNLVRQTKIAMQGNVDVIATGIENNCKKENDVIKFFSYEEEFRKVLEHAVSNQYALTEELNNNIEPLIWYYLSSDTNIDTIHIYSEMIQNDHIGDFLSIPSTDDEKAMYELCRDNYSYMWTMDSEGKIYVIKALLDSATSSRLVGVVSIKVRESSFFSMINQTGYLENGILMVDSNDNIVVKKPIKNEALDNKIVNALVGGKIGFDSENFFENREFFISASKELENGWKLYYYIDRREIMSDVVLILSSVIVLAALLFVISYYVATIYSSKLSNRVTQLNKMAMEVRGGKFDIENSDKSPDEIGQLSEAMTDMASQLKSMVDEINRRSEQDLLMKDNDIHYREWLFDFVVEKNNDILAVLGEDGYVPSFITSNVQEVLGISLDLLKQDIRCLELAMRQDGEQQESIKAIIEECIKTGDAKILDEIRLENVKTNEHLYYRGIIISTIDDGGKRTAIALYDRTQEFRRNHQLQEALNAAETANKAKTSFLANMSHDFRTPMNAITGFNLLIDKHANDPDKVREYTHKISLASQNLLSLLNDVLDMSKIESGKTTLDIKEMAIGLLIEEINSVISFQAKAKNQEYIVRVEDMEHDMFMGDKQRINEILVNILGNAVKYTPEGGRIEFTINESSSSSVGFQNVRFTIKDNGIGMKPEYKDKIFDAFTREDKSATKGIQGTGLGMAITKSLVELMGGTIRVESEEGKGSTFIVNLRLQVVEEANVDFWRAHGIDRILCVDEKKDLYEQLKASLEPDGVDVLYANSPFATLHAIDECDQEQKKIDIILVDEVVEGMAAAEIVKSIRGKDKRNNVLIFVMADDFARIDDEVRAAGCNELLQKPLFVSILKQTVEDIANRSAASEQVEEKNPLQGMKFLAAEDNDINADILIELMDMEGATVTRGVNGQEVVEMFKNANEGDYDMILMDIQMPIMNGYEAAAAIRALGTDWSQRIPIIAMTANAYADDVQQAFDAGMNAHVTKPIDIRIVEKTILEFKGN
ncbi:MAG: response regulator [Butyrivibrio sp.]|nr:response regulator [Butyrivibrio sp.]